jgi:photosystem II stability/assembly factor-like uncharacterized protein
MKKKIVLPFIAILVVCVFFINNKSEDSNTFIFSPEGVLKPKIKLENARHLYAIERKKQELNMQRNPLTGKIPLEEKRREYNTSVAFLQQKGLQRVTPSIYTSRGPSNLGGRTRAFAVDISDPTSNTMLSGGVSSGLFRTTNGGENWTKVSPQGEIHNVSAVTQDPRAGFQNIWYYGTGEFIGNSAALGAFYYGQGVWKSVDSGLTWNMIPGTDSDFTRFDSFFDFTNALEVHPLTGDLFLAVAGRIYRYNGITLTIELQLPGNSVGLTDLVITPSGKVFASFDGGTASEGVWKSPTGNGSWTQIAKNGTPTNWSATGRIVLGEAPSNDAAVYALYVNGNDGEIEADLWQYNDATNSWTDYSSKLPDEAGADLAGNDPFAVQGGYDLVVSVKPDNENFVVIGGTNTYKIDNILTDATFIRIGGYISNTSYALYENHHPDIHVLEFDPNNNNVLYSGTDGGVHETADIAAATISWESLNNNYITYQYYHVALDPLEGSNIVVGGAQDNGTTVGGTDAELSNNTEMFTIAGGDGVAVAITRFVPEEEPQLFFGFQQGNIFRFDQDGFSDIQPTGSPEDDDAQFVTYFYSDPDNNDLFYYAGSNTLYKTSDAAAVTSDNWVNAGTLSTNENLRTFATTRGAYNNTNSFLLIGGDRGGIFKVNNPRDATSISSAINITPTGATTAANTIVSGIAIHPTNPDIVLAVYANYGIDNIFLTTNATSTSPTWTLVERNLPDHSIRSAAIAQVGSEIVYFVGTARGLYSSADPKSADWEMEGANSVGLALISGLVYRPSDNKLLIGTHGNGMLETTVASTLSTSDFNNDKGEVSFFPNPAQNTLNIQSNMIDLSKNMGYAIFDITGKNVKEGVVINKKVNVEGLTSGIYFINLNIDGKKQNFKFIKN